MYSFIGKHQIVPMHSLLSLIDSNKPGGGGNTHKGLEEFFFKEKKTGSVTLKGFLWMVGGNSRVCTQLVF